MIVLIFILGLFLGSFLNVVGTRLSIGQSIVNPKRSYCEKCHHELSFLDLIPVLSYLFHKGKCRYCGTKISLFYPMIELITGVLYACSYHVFGFTYPFAVSIVLSSFLVMVISSDINYLIIPDEIIISISLILIVLSFIVEGWQVTLIKLCYGVAMFTFMYLLMLFGNWIFKKETLGGADIKLMFIVGFVLDPLISLFVVFLASVMALPISLILLMKNRERVIPYGPFLALSMLFLYFFQVNSDTLVRIFTIV